ncbi:MAG TPA: anti-sigma factor [Gemmatimonadota bacterium]|nr:anti-sigma factor [Gemmatimonadota bacterium]
MSEPMAKEEFQEQAVLYELGRLQADGRERFEAELAARGEEGRQVLEGVRRAFARAGLGPGSTTVSAERAALAAVTARPIRRRRPRARGWPLIALALLVLFVGALAWALTLQAERSGFDRERRTSAAALDSLAAEVAARDSLERARPGATDLAPIIASPDLAAVDLSGASGAYGRLLTTQDGALLVAEDLPPLSEDGSYHLWTRTPNWAVSHVTSLGSAPGGYLLARFSDATFLEGARGIFVTAETGPAGETPAGATMLQGLVPAPIQ